MESSYSSYTKIVLTVFFSSFFFLVFKNSDIYGYQAFFIGFQGLYFGEMKFLLPWLANFIFFASLVAASGGKLRLLLAFLSVTFASLPLTLERMPKYVLNDDFNIPQFGVGYILWLSSFTINLIGSIHDRLILKKRKVIDN